MKAIVNEQEVSAEITRDHPASSYGRPVLLIDGEPVGPGDAIDAQLIEVTWQEGRQLAQMVEYLLPVMERCNPDGKGWRLMQVYHVPSLSEHDYWQSVTSVPCPVPGCGQTAVWYEAGYVPGYRVCMAQLGEKMYDMDTISHRFLAQGDAAEPYLLLLDD